jgi:hypothetical protein
MRRKTMVEGSAGPEKKNNCASKGQQQITRPYEMIPDQTLSVACTIECQMVEWLVNNEWEMMSKELVIA